jgi:Cu/Ag efflux pump CusA
LAEFDFLPELATIPRRNGKRINTVKADVQADAIVNGFSNEFRQNLESGKFSLPAGYRLEFGGEEEERDRYVTERSISKNHSVLARLV